MPVTVVSSFDVQAFLVQAAGVKGNAAQALSLASELSAAAPMPGSGGTAARWQMLSDIAAIDLTAARVAEAHLDALAILSEAGLNLAAAGSTWGVFAAEAPGATVDARERPDGSWLLTGTKPWCSLAGSVSDALVTAHTPGGHRRLFAISLRDAGIEVQTGAWKSLGLAQVVSTAIELDQVSATPVGDEDWYLQRPGFAWGGMGVAACWYGGAVGIARFLFRKLAERDVDQISQMQVGAVDVQLTAARSVLAAAAMAVDSGAATGVAGSLLATRVRCVVADAAEDVITRVGHLLGPAPLALDEDHARRVADLQIYLRQHHAEKDEAALGRDVLAGDLPW
ncbi:acyl-CoA dehydrogenase [Nakamurella antarctica]|uniref:Acyl-CoA dehydrogenase n=1 Tax=Nakamurella antarctica TaxID=1902245 RepID=A0A3G8ZPF8_9ACTN|nr:acyl-CoA/acyl-ACP dehydrogenase [Nakamurella antarctica]AZI58675.1 acyl-CoA dehydrogenase [Nakamurella antarctica]